jgi:hypothetical protein
MISYRLRNSNYQFTTSPSQKLIQRSFIKQLDIIEITEVHGRKFTCSFRNWGETERTGVWHSVVLVSLLCAHALL